jgi:hypothetical protein
MFYFRFISIVSSKYHCLLNPSHSATINMSAPCDAKEEQKAGNTPSNTYLSCSYMSKDKHLILNMNLHHSKDLGAALRAYYNTIPDDPTAIQYMQLVRPAPKEADKKK